jgi:hypothetical protein
MQPMEILPQIKQFSGLRFFAKNPDPANDQRGKRPTDGKGQDDDTGLGIKVRTRQLDNNPLP